MLFLSSLLQHLLRVIPVVSEAKGLVGVVTDEGLMNYLVGEQATASDEISKAFAAEFREFGVETSLDQLRFILVKEGTGFVTKVADGKKQLLGVVTKHDVLRFLAHE